MESIEPPVSLDDQRPSEFSFDKITVTSHVDVPRLLRSLPCSQLVSQAYDFGIIPTRDNGSSRTPYRSQIYFVVPSKEFLELLLLHEKDFSPYKISYIELARDTHCPTDWDCINAARAVGMGTRKKYGASIKFDGRDKPKDIEKGLFADETYYFGTPCRSEKTGDVNIRGKLRYAVYARDSKLNGGQCAREEWRIGTAGRILKDTGIRTVRDILEADIKDLFEALSERYLAHEKIDRMKIGLWYLGMKHRKKLTTRETRRIKLRGLLYCNVWGIRTQSDLVRHFMLEKQRIRRQCGRKNQREKKILSVRDYGRFATK